MRRRMEVAMGLVQNLRTNASFLAVLFAIAVTTLALVAATCSLLARM